MLQQHDDFLMAIKQLIKIITLLSRYLVANLLLLLISN